MKRKMIFTITGLLFMTFVHFQAKSQTNCFAAFQVVQNPAQDSIWFVDYSFTTDSLSDYVNSWTWTMTGMGVTFTFTGQNPVIATGNIPAGNYTLCLTITTFLGCMNMFCDQIVLNGTGPCPITINAQVYHVTIPNGSDGAIDITVTNGVPPYSFLWNTGASSEDIYFLSSGIYSVTVSDTNCATIFSASVIEPFDSTIINFDSLLVPPIDTCFGFVPDSFYISNVSLSGNNVVIIWVFTGNGMMFTLPVTYVFNGYGNYIASVSINCNDKSFTATYMSYVNLYAGMSVEEYESALKIYPNPARDKIVISDATSLESVSIYDATGLLVGSYRMQNIIDVDHLQPGFYTIIMNTGKSIISRKLIISK
jgi:hypothetical protein